MEELKEGPHVIKMGMLTKEGHMFRTWKTRAFTLVRPPQGGVVTSSAGTLSGRNSARRMRVPSNAQGRGYLRYYAPLGKRKGKRSTKSEALFRFKGEFDLGLAEGDATVRILPPSEVGGRKHCLQVFRSKSYIKLQASTDEEAEEWAAAIDPQFAQSLKEKRFEAEVRYLYKGGDVIMHSPKGGRQLVNLRLAKDRGRILIECGEKVVSDVSVSEVEKVIAGKETAHMTSGNVQAFESNCFSLALKGEEKSSVDFEAQSGESRNRWVAALETLRKGMPHAPPSKQASSYRAGVTDEEAAQHAASAPTPPETESSLVAPSPGTQVLHQVRHTSVMKELNLSAVNESAEDIDANQQEYSDTLSPLAKSSRPATDARPAQKQQRKKTTIASMFRRKSKMPKAKALKLPYGKCVSRAIKRAVGEDGADSSGDMFSAKTYFSMNFGSDSSTFEFRSYAGGAFRNVRRHFGVSDADYIKSLSNLTGGQVGEGKSGMLFFFSADKKYVLKTVKETEKDFFFHKGILENYYKHMLTTENSLMCRFYGLYKIKFENSKWMVLIVMPNCFETPLVLMEKYDLKGSTRNRYCTPEEAKKASVLKDLNFKSKIYLDSATREEFMRIIKADTQFLIDNMIMDYSLLLGVHCPKESDATRKLHLLHIASTQNEDDSLTSALSINEDDRATLQSGANLGASFTTRHATSMWQKDLGGIEGRTPDMKPVVYLMSVIDILQYYDRSKRMENMLKSRLHDEKAISAVHPKMYGERFISYLDSIVVGIEGVNEIIQTEREKILDELSAEGTTESEKIKEETKAAIESTLEDKAEENEVVFSSKLEDGTKIELLFDGSQRQRNPDGTRIVQSADGEITQTNPDGLIIVTAVDGERTITSPDGQVDLIHGDGSSETRFINGAVLFIDPMGNRVQKNPDGSTVEQPLSGETITKTADGSTVTSFPDGRKVTKFADGITEIEVLPDGTTKQKSKGVTLVKRPSGSMIQRHDSGTTIEVRSDGVKVQTTKEGIVQTTYADGSMHMEGYSDGRVVDVAGGVTTTTFENGVVVIKSPNGDIEQRMPDSTILRVTSDGKKTMIRADGTVVEEQRLQQ